MSYVLVLYDSRGGKVAKMAEFAAEGVRKSGYDVRIRTVAPVGVGLSGQPDLPKDGPIYATIEDLSQCSGLLLGSPTRFGNMSADLKYFIDQTSAVWMSGGLVNKPAGVFTSTGSLHGGQESTLLSMMIPLFHHGMILVGIPYTEPGLTQTRGGGTPYGASHHAGSPQNPREIDADERQLVEALGARVGSLALQLSH